MSQRRTTIVSTQIHQNQSHFKGMRFCKECDNMLYPREQIYDDHAGISKLIFDCRICGHFDKAREGDEWDNCVYKSDYTQRGLDAGSKFSGFNEVSKDIIKDPTLLRRNGIECPNKKYCQNTQAVSYTQPTKDRLNLVYVCTGCTYAWTKEAIDNRSDVQMGDSDSD